MLFNLSWFFSLNDGIEKKSETRANGGGAGKSDWMGY